MNNAKLNVVKFDNNDVIATSGFLQVGESYVFSGFTDNIANNASLSNSGVTKKFTEVGFNSSSSTEVWYTNNGKSAKLNTLGVVLGKDADGSACSAVEWNQAYIWDGTRFHQ